MFDLCRHARKIFYPYHTNVLNSPHPSTRRSPCYFLFSPLSSYSCRVFPCSTESHFSCAHQLPQILVDGQPSNSRLPIDCTTASAHYVPYPSFSPSSTICIIHDKRTMAPQSLYHYGKNNLCSLQSKLEFTQFTNVFHETSIIDFFF